MKAFLRKTALFSLFSMVAYFLLLIIWGNFAHVKLHQNLKYRKIVGSSATRFAEVKKTKNIDILFLGSSLCYRGFDPRIFSSHGYSSFNMGSSNQTPMQTKVLLLRYLEQLNPKLIIYEVSPLMFHMDGIESSYDLINHDVIDFELIKMSFMYENIGYFNTMLYIAFKGAAGRTKAEKDQNKIQATEKKQRYIEGGFVETKNRFFEKEIYLRKNRNKKRKWDIRGYQQKAFEVCISIINDKKIPYILVQAPITQSRYNLYTNNEEVEKLFEISGNYLNFMHIIQMDDSLHFYDSRHLNQDGVELFNTKLIEILKKTNGAIN